MYVVVPYIFVKGFGVKPIFSPFGCTIKSKLSSCGSAFFAADGKYGQQQQQPPQQGIMSPLRGFSLVGVWYLPACFLLGLLS